MKDIDLLKSVQSIREGLIEVNRENQREPDLLAEALIESVFLLCRVIQERPT